MAARELRDRYLEEVNSADGRVQLEANGKYDVSRPRKLTTVVADVAQTIRLLDAA